MQIHKASSKLDHIGMTASTLCAIHCAIVPVLLSVLPLAGLGFLANPLVEWGMILLALLLGVSSIFLSYLRTHRRLLPLLMLVAGFVIIIAGHIFLHGWIEAIIVPAGGLTIAAAHFINFKYADVCKNNTRLINLKHTHSGKYKS